MNPLDQQSFETSSNPESSKPKVSSACDGCKRRKVRCTGMQPCDRCAANGIACTYGSTTGRYDFIFMRFIGWTSTITYTRHLERRIAELETLLRQQAVAENEEEGGDIQPFQERPNPDMVETLAGPQGDQFFEASATTSTLYHGHFSGLSILRMVRDLCTSLTNTPDVPADTSGHALARVLDSAASDVTSRHSFTSISLLPPHGKLERVIATAIDFGLDCPQLINREQINHQIETLYRKEPEDYTERDRTSLALIYALLALGRRYDSNIIEGRPHGEDASDVLKGAAYFRVSRLVFETTHVHNLDSIRTILVLASYLLASSMMSKAYSYICNAVGIAFRMGLHISLSDSSTKFSPEEMFERRQVFGVLNLMDTYLASLLGLPKMLRDADPKQSTPVPNDQMHDKGNEFVSKNPFSPVSQIILYADLFEIQAKITRNRFPSNKSSFSLPTQPNRRFEEEMKKIDAREKELQGWHTRLPEIPATTAVDPLVLRSQLLFRIYFTSVRISLYRPFLHHVIRKKSDPDFDFNGYACASACIESAMQAVWLIDAFDRHGFLYEAQWCNIYLLALAGTALMFFVLGTGQGPTVEESRAAAERARELLRKLGQGNSVARRCYESLAALPLDGTDEPTRGAAAVAAAAAGGRSPRSQFMMGIGAMMPMRELGDEASEM